MANDDDDRDIPGAELLSEPLRRALGDRYLTYALSTITNRALPDARDGLKPVHRRILYTMRNLRLAPDGSFRKCAKICGDVTGNLHPHDDESVYDALARMAQWFTMRYPLVDPQGNFGNIDGDRPAARRYTEARQTQAAVALIEGIDEDAVAFRPNYDGLYQEPVVLPAAFPNLLANGASGIAVGMATSIPPHNLDELIAGCLHLIKAPNATHEKLMELVPGPDFPTGGVLVESPENTAEAYRTGRGSMRLRARWAVEDLGRGQWQIVVTEIPFQVPKSKLIERIAELVTAKKIPILADIRDESAEDIRVILEPRSRSVEPAMLMETLFRNSDLETRVSLNMNVLIDGKTPKVCDLREVLRAFLDHRQDVLRRRSQHRLDKIAKRLEVLEGYLIAYLNLDRVIQIIRTEDEPKPVMMAEFKLTETQAEAILNMRLRALRKLEEMEIRGERDRLMAEQEELTALLASDDLQWNKIATELRAVRKAMGKGTPNGSRRTTIEAAPLAEEVPLDAMIEREPITVVCSRMGWIRALKGHVALDQEMKFKDGDGPRFAFHAETTDKLVVFGENGRFYTLPAAELPGGRGAGEPLRLTIDLPNEADITALFVHKPGRKLIVASSAGDGFVVAEDDVIAQTRTGKQVLNLKEGARAAICRPASGDYVACVASNNKMLIFPLADLPEMGRGKGVRLQNVPAAKDLFNPNASVLTDALVFNLGDGITWKDGGGRTRTETDVTDWIGKRAGAGRKTPRGFPRDNKFTENGFW